MIRRALHLCLAVVAAVVLTERADACAYDAIHVLPSSFDPTGAATDPPTSTAAPTANVQADITAALALAPQFFKTQLCNLDGIYVTQGPESWGYRNIANGKRYVALSASLWDASGPTKKYSKHQDEVAARLLKSWPGLGHNPGPNNAADTPAMAVLAALAHEFGHVLFYDTFVSPRGSAPTYTNPNFCGGTFFTDSWQILPATPIPWRAYGIPAGSHKSDDMQTSDLLAVLPPSGGSDYRAGRKLDQIYSLTGTNSPRGRWASLFATFSPDEDFVETFKLFVMKNAAQPLASMPALYLVDGTFVTQDIPATCSQRPVLVKKLGCFAQKFCATQPAPSACGRCP